LFCIFQVIITSSNDI
jgi:methionine-gamma-lyase